MSATTTAIRSDAAAAQAQAEALMRSTRELRGVLRHADAASVRTAIGTAIAYAEQAATLLHAQSRMLAAEATLQESYEAAPMTGITARIRRRQEANRTLRGTA